MSPKRATPKKEKPSPAKGPNLFSFFQKVAENAPTPAGADAGAAAGAAEVVDLTDAGGRETEAGSVMKGRGDGAGVCDVAGGAGVVPDKQTRGMADSDDGEGEGEGEQGSAVGPGASTAAAAAGAEAAGETNHSNEQSPQPSVGDAFLTPAHHLRMAQRLDDLEETPTVRSSRGALNFELPRAN
jgi:hypothetical protein